MTALVYREWACWLVVDTGAPWNWKPDVLPPDPVLREMPAFMYDQDNRSTDGTIIRIGATPDDYAWVLGQEWDCAVKLEAAS